MLVDLRASELFSLRGRTALLTGASGYLGQVMGRALLANGARLIALARSDRLHDRVGEWRQEFGADSVEVRQLDMYDLPQLESCLDELCSAHGSIDVLVNNAHELGPRTGFNVPDGSLELAGHDQWMRQLTGGVYWPALTSRKIGAKMKARGHGSIVNVSTMYALVAPNPDLYRETPFANPPGYSAAKAALVALTRYTASYWGPHGVRVNALLPGPFPNVTDMAGDNTVGAEEEFLKRLERRTCLRRTGRAEELAGALVFLASDASSYVTGHGLVVDGGWTIT